MSTLTEQSRGKQELRRQTDDGFTIIESRWVDTDTKWVEIWSGPESRADAVWAELAEGE